MKASCALLLLALACSARGSSEAEHIHVLLTPQPGSTLDPHSVRARPESAVSAISDDGKGVLIEVKAGTRTLEVDIDGACPLQLPLSDARPGERREFEVLPWLRAEGGDLAQLGFDAPFVVTLVPGCREALRSRISWKQVGGKPVQLSPSKDGLVLRGRTTSFGGSAPWGVVPVSARTQGKFELRATTEKFSLRVRGAAAARSGGLPSVPVSQKILLGGSGWRIDSPAPGGVGRLTDRGSQTWFQPDARGRWTLKDGQGRVLSLAAGSHSETPLDCGRSDCHAKESEAVLTSAMTSVLVRGLSGKIPGYDPDCALACHAVGEPGLADGGFVAVARDFGMTKWNVHDGAWDELPRALRRLGGVTCTACHGPGAIPEPSARWAILRSDVCATCHDAPPRYSHMVRWQATRMSRADRDARTRSDTACRGCHTSSGFLARLGVRADLEEGARELELGIGCVACHAPHAKEFEPRLVRRVPLPKDLTLPESARRSRICVGCHGMREASEALLMFPKGDLGAHAKIPGGCLGCHGGSTNSPDVRGASHDFGVDRHLCTRGCHQDGKLEADVSIASRALGMLRRLGVSATPAPAHARPLPSQSDSKQGLALELVLTVASDPQAAIHDAKRARALLDRAEALLGDGK